MTTADEGTRMPAQRGLTIVEVVVALTVLAAALAVGMRAHLVLVTAAGRGGERSVAAALATQTLEQVRSGPEAAGTLSARRAAFDALTSRPRARFAPPVDTYEHEVTVDQLDTTPAEPCWLVADPPGLCGPQMGHDNMMKWVTVRVYHKGSLMARMDSGLIRGMFHSR